MCGLKDMKCLVKNTYVGGFWWYCYRVIVPRIELQHLEIAADSDLLQFLISLVKHLMLSLDEIVRELLAATSSTIGRPIVRHLATFIIFGFLGQC